MIYNKILIILFDPQYLKISQFMHMLSVLQHAKSDITSGQWPLVICQNV